MNAFHYSAQIRNNTLSAKELIDKPDTLVRVFRHLCEAVGDTEARHLMMPVAVIHENGVPTFRLAQEQDDREPWQRFFMNRAYAVAERSTCKSVRNGRKVGIGAVFTRGTVDLVSGYNGVPSKFPHPVECERIKRGCKSGQDLHLCPCNHAEQNAIANAAENNISLRGTSLYCTARPCHICMGVLAGIGVERIIYDVSYPFDGHADLSSDIAGYRGIPVLQLDEAIKLGVL